MLLIENLVRRFREWREGETEADLVLRLRRVCAVPVEAAEPVRARRRTLDVYAPSLDASSRAVNARAA